MWVPEHGATGQQLAACRAICARCPVQDPCIAWGLTFRDAGIYGGFTSRQRDRLRRARTTDIGIITGPACGTHAGYETHRRNGSQVCEECRLAHNRYAKQQRNLKRES